MKSSQLVILITVALFCSQAKQPVNDIPADIPACLVVIINQLKARPLQAPPGGVWQYIYQGKRVYYIPAGCCDQYNLLYNEQCTVICSPDGGITGRGDGRCADFITTRQEEKIVWKYGQK